jgi:hypothetical protein
MSSANEKEHLSGIQSKTDEMLGSAEFEAARAAYGSLKKLRKQLIAAHTQIELARQLASMPEPIHERAAVAVQMAGTELALARRNPRRTAARMEDLADEIARLQPEFDAAKLKFEALASAEAHRLAEELRPKHEQAVRGIAASLEALSRALADEISVRDEFLKRAPAPGLGCPLPNLAAHFLRFAWLPHRDSTASAWGREARSKGYLT